MSRSQLASSDLPPNAWRVRERTRGHTHGPITRLMSPGDLGQQLKPFVFLDHFADAAAKPMLLGWHPHSGIATLSYLLRGSGAFEETTGAKGVLPAGGIEWMQAGNGVWHTAGSGAPGAIAGYQLWLALPPELENAPARSVHLQPDDVPQEGPARVLLGRLGQAVSRIPAPPGITYLHLELAAGDSWTFTPAAGQTVVWLALHRGRLARPETINAGELVIFQPGSGGLTLYAEQAATIIFGAAVPHPHDLVLGHYSVHTSRRALNAGEAEIRRIEHQLLQQGLLT